MKRKKIICLPLIIISIILVSCEGEESCLVVDWEGVFEVSNSNTDMECAEMLFDELEFSVVSAGIVGLQGFELNINTVDCLVSWVENEFEFLVVLMGRDKLTMRFTERGQSCEVLYERK